MDDLIRRLDELEKMMAEQEAEGTVDDYYVNTDENARIKRIVGDRIDLIVRKWNHERSE